MTEPVLPGWVRIALGAANLVIGIGNLAVANVYTSLEMVRIVPWFALGICFLAQGMIQHGKSRRHLVGRAAGEAATYAGSRDPSCAPSARLSAERLA